DAQAPPSLPGDRAGDSRDHPHARRGEPLHHRGRGRPDRRRRHGPRAGRPDLHADQHAAAQGRPGGGARDRPSGLARARAVGDHLHHPDLGRGGRRRHRHRRDRQAQGAGRPRALGRGHPARL
ncbi:MAG: hypothetical protein AVDCRST_MAG18-4086, partial [uncultured Thermomicrobiales bacterium]